MRFVNITPEQYSLLAYVRSLAWWVEPVAITPFGYRGQIAGCELLTYAANKLYIALDVEFGMNGTAATNVFNIYLYDESNTLVFAECNNSYYWDAAGAAYKAAGNLLQNKNFYFSRFATGNYTYVRFQGYKLTK